MTVAEIIILIIGAVLFTASFFIPDKSEKNITGIIDEESARRAVSEAVSQEMKRIRTTIDEATEESISDNKDKMERYMDRLTNEKMMAVNEYSDTVLEQIHKDHQEAVFLYDMIDSKYSQVKNTAAEINQIEKSVRKLSEDIPKEDVRKVSRETTSSSVKDMPKSVIKEQAKPVKPVKPLPKKVEVTTELKKPEYTVSFEPLEVETASISEPAEEKIAEKTMVMTTEKIIPESVGIVTSDASLEDKPEPVTEKPAPSYENTSEESVPAGGVELMFDSDSNSMNNNDRILALHKEGKSNMAIAKELGLGVGEVKLVIDLFKSY